MTATRRPTIQAMPETSGTAPILDAIDRGGDALSQAMRRRLASYAEIKSPAELGIKARDLPIRSRSHSRRHKAIR